MISREECLYFIVGKGNGYLYHFTCVENLPLIGELGGICSKEKLEDLGEWPVPCPGGDSLSHCLDKKRGIWGFVSTQFARVTPMSMKKEHECRLCMFAINPLVACDEGVLFTRKNATKNNAEGIPGIDGLEKVDWYAVTHPPEEVSGWKHRVQAEALIPDKIPLSMVERVAFASESSRDTSRRLWSGNYHPDLVVDESFFSNLDFP